MLSYCVLDSKRLRRAQWRSSVYLFFFLLLCSLETLAKHAMELIKSPAMRTLRRLMTVRTLPVASLLMLYYCFTHALLLLYSCFTTAVLMLYYSFTHALLLLYCCFTAA